MNSQSDITISQVLSVGNIKSIIQDVIRLIEEVSGQKRVFEITQTDSKSSMQRLSVVTISNERQVASVTVDVDINTNLVKQCSCFFENDLVKLDSKGDLMDYLFLSLCPSMCIVRSIMYMIENCKHGMDPKKVDNQLSVDTQTNLTQTNICIYGKDDAFVELQLSSDLTHFVCFPNGNRKKQGINLPPFLSIENIPHTWYLEKAFANKDTDNYNAVPCPQTLQAMELIFNLIGLDFIAKQQQQQQSTLSENTSDSQAPIYKKTHTQPRGLLGG